MKHFLFPFVLIFFYFFSSTSSLAQEQFSKKYSFSDTEEISETIGKGLCEVNNAILYSKDKYALFGSTDWKDYEFEFEATSVDTLSEVHISAGFRATDRYNRYLIGLKGGSQNELYLAKLGYMGADDYLSLKPLRFIPLKNKWYHFKIQVAENRIRIFLNNESIPRIDVIDNQPLRLSNGKITLGGSWIKTAYRNLQIKSIDPHSLDNESNKEYSLPEKDKEKERKKERSLYSEIRVVSLNANRNEIPLNGNWLFCPDYEIKKNSDAVSPESSDQSWHIMHVPDFWNPTRIWLYGERYNTASKGVSDNYYQKEIDRCSNYTFDYKKTNIGWYRQWIHLPKSAFISGKHTELVFDAVSKVAEVWVNGIKAGSHIGMFGTFSIDVTPYLHEGKNLLAIKVLKDYVPSIKDADKIADVAVTVEVTQKMLKDIAHGFYQDDPAGIWQPVKLVITNPIKIEDVYIKPSLTGSAFDITIKNNLNIAQKVNVLTSIADSNNNSLFTDTSVYNILINAGETKIISYSINNIKPLLWSPEHPNLYNFNFSIINATGQQFIDTKRIVSGFRTFEVRGDYFYLNGQPFWLRGSDHTPMSLAPNDSLLADVYCKRLREGNVNATRTHTAPYTETWMNASDKNGIGVSYEGSWPWLMINGTMPDNKLIELWRTEFLDLLKKYRNHPSLLFWTVNNEMKFYDNDPDFERTKVKMKIISDVVKQMRKIDPSRPVCFDSNYERDIKKFGKTYFDTIDDGDIDDKHWYINWYHGSLFEEFNGEFQNKFKNEGRPLISQEMSTGYPDETGHPTRFYAMVHQTSSSLIGNYSYDFCNPDYFSTTHAFITKELAEALRRTNDKAAGIMHFAGLTWFKNVYDANKIAPHPTYFAMQKALQPVLVSAELWGRHFYAGSKIPVQLYVVNDQENGKDLVNVKLGWKIVTASGESVANGMQEIPFVKYYSRYKTELRISIPEKIPAEKSNVKLVLTLEKDNLLISQNEYDILLATKNWVINNIETVASKVVVVDFLNMLKPALDFAKLPHTECKSVAEAFNKKAALFIFSGMNEMNTSNEELTLIQTFVSKGGKVLLLNSGSLAQRLFPQYIRGFLKDKGDIANIEIPESGIFNNIEPLEIRYFNNNLREIPLVTNGAYQINKTAEVNPLISFTKIHGYLQGNMIERQSQLDKIKGFPVVMIQNNGRVILSELLLNKATTDPIAGKLLLNMIAEMLQ